MVVNIPYVILIHKSFLMLIICCICSDGKFEIESSDNRVSRKANKMADELCENVIPRLQKS